MTPRGDRSIRNIPVPKSHKARSAPPAEQPMYEEDFTAQVPRRRRFPGRRFWWILIAVVVLFAIIGISMAQFFSGATVTVSARTAQVTAPATMDAELNAPQGTLAYVLVTSTKTATTTVPASGVQKVSRAASGVITIYNDYSTASQQLATNTRFESPDGKIYRIHQSVTVPGATKASDGSLTPGHTSLTAYADQPGADYNRGQTQFTIPGFMGDPQYTKFYAETDSMSGGLVGTEPSVASADLTAAEHTLTSALQNSMSNVLQSPSLKGFIAIPGTLAITYSDVTQTPGATSTAMLSETATAVADVIRADALASAVAKQTVQGYNGEAVTFSDPSAVTVSLVATSSSSTMLELGLSGTPTLMWQFDQNTLKQALVGQPKSDFETILKSFAPAIICSNDTPCQASLRPFWAKNFPGNPDKIEILTKEPS